MSALRPTLAVVCPNRHHHGIDFKNPFTMSKREDWPPINRRIATPELVSSSNWIFVRVVVEPIGIEPMT